MKKAVLAIIGLLALLSVAAILIPNQVDLGIYPPKTEMTLVPGEHSTVTFWVESSAWIDPSETDLKVSLVDWRADKDGTVRYVGPGTWFDSASSWATYSPGRLMLAAGATEPIRVTVKVPPQAEPGIYRTGVLVEQTNLPRGRKFSDVFRISIRVMPERPGPM